MPRIFRGAIAALRTFVEPVIGPFILSVRGCKLPVLEGVSVPLQQDRNSIGGQMILQNRRRSSALVLALPVASAATGAIGAAGAQASTPASGQTLYACVTQRFHTLNLINANTP